MTTNRGGRLMYTRTTMPCCNRTLPRTTHMQGCQIHRSMLLLLLLLLPPPPPPPRQ